MDRKMLETEIIKILADRLNVDSGKIQLTSDLVNDLGMDSFGGIEVGYAIEDKFKIEISEEDFKNIQKVQDIVEHVEKSVSKNKELNKKEGLS